MEESTKSRRFVLIQVSCPYLHRTVILFDDTWRHKISKEHKEVSNRADLVKKILESPLDDTVAVYQKQRDPSRVAIFKKCPHLLPYYNYIKITVKLINDKEARMTSCYGQDNVPGFDMEAYDGR